MKFTSALAGGHFTPGNKDHLMNRPNNITSLLSHRENKTKKRNSKFEFKH